MFLVSGVFGRTSSRRRFIYKHVNVSKANQLGNERGQAKAQARSVETKNKRGMRDTCSEPKARLIKLEMNATLPVP